MNECERGQAENGLKTMDTPQSTDEGRQRPLILIVDDVKANIQVLAEILRDLGEVAFATDGPTALARAAELRPNLILLDVAMPGMDGHEVCRRLAADEATRHIPVIFVTARSDDSDEEAGLALGAIDFIRKPLSPTIVRARVRNHLAFQQTAADLRVANAELRRLAATDPLTGVFNRRRFLELAETEMRRLGRNGRAFGLIMMDVDHFKSINDTRGHAAGDHVLKAMADTCVGHLRTVDAVGRLGGEEFAILLPETDLPGVRLTAERLRESLGGLEVPINADTINFTISAGYTAVSDARDTVDDALKRADEALYQAKKLGRNRAICHADLKGTKKRP